MALRTRGPFLRLLASASYVGGKAPLKAPATCDAYMTTERFHLPCGYAAPHSVGMTLYLPTERSFATEEDMQKYMKMLDMYDMNGVERRELVISLKGVVQHFVDIGLAMTLFRWR